MDGWPGHQEALLGEDMWDVAEINLGEVNAVILGAHDDRARLRGPDPHIAHADARPRRDDANGETRVDRARGTQDRLDVTHEAIGVAEASANKSTDRYHAR